MKSKVLAIAIAWLLCVVGLLFIMLQMQSYAGIINDAGVVRGGTQRAVKLELAGMPNQDIVQRVDSLLASLHSGEEGRIFQSGTTVQLTDDLDAIQRQWDLIKQEFAALERGEGSQENLLALSEEHFRMADEMVLSAQKRADIDFAWTIGGMLAVIVVVSAFVSLLERHHRLKERRSLLVDPLTGGRNLFAFEEDGGGLVEGAAEGSYFVAYSNVVGFRTINELFGREAGDQTILLLQRTFAEAVGRGEIDAHANADHFALLLKSGDDPRRRMRALQELVEGALDTLPFSDRLTCSYGAFPLDDKGIGLDTAVSNAFAVLKDGALVDGVCWYDDAFRRQLAHSNNLLKYCEKGLEGCEFEPYLQPQVNLADGRLTGAELLCRWNSPDLGFLMPDSFIPQFERNGFIVKLDFHMLERALAYYASLENPSDQALRISINLSRVTILHPGFDQRLEGLFKRYGISPQHLDIEITEGLFAVDQDAVIDILTRLRTQGYRFAMDDFGTGYSSLSLLRKLPIDVLKIDRGFLSQSTETDDARRVLRGVIDLADDLGIETVCEGIERADQAEMLAAMGCTTGQGYLYDRPIPLDEFERRYQVGRGRANAASPTA